MAFGAKEDPKSPQKKGEARDRRRCGVSRKEQYPRAPTRTRALLFL